MRNSRSIEMLEEIAGQLNTTSYAEWRNTTPYGISGNHVKYLNTVFDATIMLCEFEDDGPHTVNFSRLFHDVQWLIKCIPHIEVSVDYLLNKNEAFASFMRSERVDFPYQRLMIAANDEGFLDSDRFKRGLGDGMPFNLVLKLSSRIAYSRDNNPSLWIATLPLCNDFYFSINGHDSNPIVTFYFEDEEDFLEASLIMNAS